MQTSGVGAAAAAPDATSMQHPSEPINTTGPALGTLVRAAYGESGISAFPLMLGGAEFGWSIDQAHSFEILDRYRELGGNIVHTSDGFAGGRSEHIIGQWLRARSARSETIVAVRIGSHPDHPGLSSTNLVRAVEASLTRLDIEHIDVVYLDGSDSRSPLEDTLATAEWLAESGKVGAFGAYGLSPERLVEARILSSAGYPRLTMLDVPYNLVRREAFEGDLRLVAVAQSLAVTPSHALEHGFLSGLHRSRARLQGARGMQMLGNMNRKGTKVLRVLDRIAAEIGVPDAAVAVAWLLAQRAVVAPIVNAYAAAHVDELVQGVGTSLGRAHMAELQKVVL